MVDVEQRLRDLLTDDHLAVRVPAGALDAVHAGVRRRRRRTRVVSAAGVVAVAAAVAAVVVPVAVGRTPHGSPGGVATQATRTWPAGPITPLPATIASPAAMAVSRGVVWVAGPAVDRGGNDVLARLDTASGRVSTTAVGAVSDMAATPRHLWLALRGCTLELHETTHGGIVSTYPLPCDSRAGTGPVVTANGGEAWVASDDGSRTHVGLYAVGGSKPVAQRVLPGRLAGPHLLAIGGASVYVVTRGRGDGAVLHQLSGTDLRPLATISLTSPRLMAYGSGHLYVADAAGVVALAPDLSSERSLVSGSVTTLTTGDNLVWCDAVPGGGLAGIDPRTGKVAGIAEVSPDRGELLRADGAAIWAVGTYPGVGVGVRSAQPG